MDDKIIPVWRQSHNRNIGNRIPQRGFVMRYAELDPVCIICESLSNILHKKEGYKLGTGAKRCNLSNLFFVDDLKLYAISLEQLLNLLKIVVEYSKDIGMSFGDSKCAYTSVYKEEKEKK